MPRQKFYENPEAEEVNGSLYKDLDHARKDIGNFIDTVYNTGRLHSALGYKPPVEFEEALSPAQTSHKMEEPAMYLF